MFKKRFCNIFGEEILNNVAPWPSVFMHFYGIRGNYFSVSFCFSITNSNAHTHTHRAQSQMLVYKCLWCIFATVSLPGRRRGKSDMANSCKNRLLEMIELVMLAHTKRAHNGKWQGKITGKKHMYIYIINHIPMILILRIHI